MWLLTASIHQYKYMKYQLVPTSQLKQTIDEYLANLTNDKVVELYDKTKNWLLKHEVKPDTNNQIDINGKPYSHKQYEIKLRLLENIENEGRKRELVAFMSKKEIKEIFSTAQP